jgi:predicted regulator of Ras-like GTPase activity (Roadblock/LC7/MglB family)
VVTETLATLLRAQGHLGEAHVAYRELARTEPEPERARRLLGLAEEISAVRAGTVRGRLEAWVEPFSKCLGRRDVDLSVAVEEVVERLGHSAAVVTDFEGVPVVDAGPRSEAEAMENLSAELTAFWKNVRRSRAEIGEGALDSLVLSGSAGTVAVKAITPAYALLLKTGPGIPAGRIRFEAERAAGKLRPALV